MDPIPTTSKSRPDVVRRIVAAAVAGMESVAQDTTAGEMLAASMTISRGLMQAILEKVSPDERSAALASMRNGLHQLLLDTTDSSNSH
jgi:hypothetical protein